MDDQCKYSKWNETNRYWVRFGDTIDLVLREFWEIAWMKMWDYLMVNSACFGRMKMSPSAKNRNSIRIVLHELRIHGFYSVLIHPIVRALLFATPAQNLAYYFENEIIKIHNSIICRSEMEIAYIILSTKNSTIISEIRGKNVIWLPSNDLQQWIKPADVICISFSVGVFFLCGHSLLYSIESLIVLFIAENVRAPSELLNGFIVIFIKWKFPAGIFQFAILFVR